MTDQPDTPPTQPGPFYLYDAMNRIVGTIMMYPDGAHILVRPSWSLGRQDLRKIAHRIMEIADFDTGLQE